MNEMPSLREASRQFVRLIKLIRPYWLPLIKDLLIGLVLAGIGLITPYLSKLLIDRVYPDNNVTLMHLIVGGILAISVTSTLIGSIQAYFSAYIGTKLRSVISLMFFNQLQHLPMRFFDEHRVGEVMSRFQDVGASLNIVTGTLRTVFLNGFYLILVPPILFLMNWQLALVSIIGIPFTVTITAISGKILRPRWKKTSEAYADLNAFQFETLSHIRTLKALALEHYVFSKTSEHFLKIIHLQLNATGLGQWFGALSGIISALATALFTWYGWRLILAQEITLGDYIAFSAYIGYLHRPISQFINLFSQFQQSSVNLERMFEYLDSPVEQNPAQAHQAVQPIQVHLKGAIDLQNISFGYTSDKLVLNDISLSIPAGTTTAVVGLSGSGKTSLLRLLTRFAEPANGRILIDNTPIHHIPLPDLRRQIAIVWQEVSLLNGTIWENLTLGINDPSPEFINEMIKLCRLDDLIAELPQGYQTNVAEWGASLSGGQRQRLAIVRALIRDTPILILDEATSNIDMQTEKEILEGIFTQLKQKTIIFVTHRISWAAQADQVCVLDTTGRLAAAGTHQQLLQESHIYQQMLEVVTTAPENGYHAVTIPSQKSS